MNSFQTKKITIGIAFLMIFIACNKETISDIFDLSITNRLVINVANIQVVDASVTPTGGYTSFKEGEILAEVVGENKEKIFNLNGFKALSYGNGFINIGVPPRDTPSLANPLKFSLRIWHKDKPGYQAETISFNLTSNEIENRIVRLLNIDDLPTGVSVSKASQTNAACQMTDSLVLSTKFKFANNEKTVITIPANTTFFDKAGNRLCGDVQGTLLSFNPSAKDIWRHFPGGYPYKKAIDTSGQDFGNGIFTAYGFFSLQIKVGGVDAYTFTPSATVSVDVLTGADAIKRTLLGTPNLSNGNLVPTWNSNKDSLWLSKGMARVQNNAMNFNIQHTGWWTVADPSCINTYNWVENKFSGRSTGTFTRCPSCSDVSLTFVTKQEVNSSYYTEISLASNNKMILASPSIEYRNGIKRNLADALGDIDQGVRINFKVYDVEPWNGGQVLPGGTKDNIYPCGAAGVLDLTSINFPQFASITTHFNLNCPNSSGTLTTLSPRASIYAKELLNNGQNEVSTWNYIGIIEQGKGTTTKKLQGGKMYKFGIFPNSMYSFTTDLIEIKQAGSPLAQPQRGIWIPSDLESNMYINFKKPEWKLNEAITIKSVSHKVYRLDMTWTPDTSICGHYKRLLGGG